MILSLEIYSKSKKWKKRGKPAYIYPLSLKLLIFLAYIEDFDIRISRYSNTKNSAILINTLDTPKGISILSL
ncbi:hypothetical protein [Nostoc sp. MG11]|uniref:hypothetical protein n=1 Tax=Nostoc sp. MG11 TaxID=2721166 RepID=UPI001865C1E6|nr:hypothetical protein [Nostoc sp. MG11]